MADTHEKVGNFVRAHVECFRASRGWIRVVAVSFSSATEEIRILGGCSCSCSRCSRCRADWFQTSSTSDPVKVAADAGVNVGPGRRQTIHAAVTRRGHSNNEPPAPHGIEIIHRSSVIALCSQTEI